MDAVDTALLEFDNDVFQLIGYEQYPIADDLRTAVKQVSVRTSLQDISKLDNMLGHLFAESALNIIRQTNTLPADIAAIGSHGQTVLHLPGGNHGRSVQIGDANIIAYKTGITTVTDFRRMDIAAGGEGAPLAPAFHAAFLRSHEKNRLILNIGGIANITVLPADTTQEVTGFDTGPGNGLLDVWNQRHCGTHMDRDGHWANSGQADSELLKHLQNDAFFSTAPPKSTGRDFFNLDWLENKLNAFARSLQAQDVQATLVDLTIHTITEAIVKHALQTEEIYICGGGVHNPLLIRGLKAQLADIQIESTEKLGINPDAVEAISFAWLAKCRLEGAAANLPSVTGAKEPVVLGAVYAPRSRHA